MPKSFMKITLSIAVLFFFFVVYANMASPYMKGTGSSTAFSSKNVDITGEKIHIIIDSGFTKAFYKITYNINCDSPGVQVPLLFYAMDYKSDFKIWLDDKEVEVMWQNMQDERPAFTADFLSAIEYRSSADSTPMVKVKWDEKTGTLYNLSDLKFFRVMLSKGSHTIRVEYEATPWTDRSQWVRESFFRYSLSPARHWKSFGSLEVSIDASRLGDDYKTNLGEPSLGDRKNIAMWSFNALPGETIKISQTPPVSAYANRLISLEPDGIAMILGLILVLLHLWAMVKFRRKYPEKKQSAAVTIGGLLVPLFVLVAYIFSFEYIDSVIGKNAGRYHGYTIFSILLYPFLLIIYLPAMWLIDRFVLKKRNRQD